ISQISPRLAWCPRQSGTLPTSCAESTSEDPPALSVEVVACVEEGCGPRALTDDGDDGPAHSASVVVAELQSLNADSLVVASASAFGPPVGIRLAVLVILAGEDPAHRPGRRDAHGQVARGDSEAGLRQVGARA